MHYFLDSSALIKRYITENFRVLWVRAAIVCSFGVKAMGGFHIMDSSSW
jgi:hypothetical protein